jgi:hypothetical protein
MQDNMLSLINQDDPNSAAIATHAIDEAYYNTVKDMPYNQNQAMLYNMLLSQDSGGETSKTYNFAGHFNPQFKAQQEMAFDSDQLEMSLEDMDTNVFEPHLEQETPEGAIEGHEGRTWTNNEAEIFTNYNHPLYLQTVAGKTIEVDGELRHYTKDGYSYKVYHDDPNISDAHYLTTTHNIFTGKPNANTYDELASYYQKSAKGSSDELEFLVGTVMAGYSIPWQIANVGFQWGGDIIEGVGDAWDWLWD